MPARQSICVYLVSIVLAGCASPSHETVTETVDIIPRQILVGNATISEVRLSPDGSRISWVAPVDGVNNVHVAPRDDLDEFVIVTHSDSRDITGYFWAPNNQDIYFFADPDGSESSSLFVTDSMTGEVRSLFDAPENGRVIPQGVSPNRPDEILVGVNGRDPQFFDLVRINVRTGERELVAENPGFQSWIMDANLEPRIGQRGVDEGGAQLVTLEGEVIATVPMEDAFSTYGFGFSDGGATLLMRDSRGRDKSVITALDMQTGETTVIADHARVDLANTLRVPGTGEVIAVRADYLKPEWLPVGDALAEDLAWLKQNLGTTADIVDVTTDTQQMIVYVDESTVPGAYYLFDRQTRSLDLLFMTRPDLAPYTFSTMHPRVIQSRDGLELVSYLTLPIGSDPDNDGVPTQPVPMVLLVHGGPWERDSYGFNATVQHLANRGYGVLQVNFRGSTGFGKRFTRAAIGEFGGAMHDDLIDAIDWAIEDGIARDDQIAIMGASYGGYAALVGATFTPDRFACTVDLVGMSNLVGLIESFPPYWRPFLQNSWYAYIGDPEIAEDRERMLERSPISRVDDVAKPIIIFQGQNDPRVTRDQSDNFVAGLSANGIPYTYVLYPDEGHGFGRSENFESFYALTEQFLAGCLGGRSEPLGDILDRSSAVVLEGAELVGVSP